MGPSATRAPSSSPLGGVLAHVSVDAHLRTRYRPAVTSDISALRSGATASRIRELRLIVVLRRVEPRDRLVSLVEELLEDGIRIVEITFDAADAGADLESLRSRFGADLLVGAGTLRTADQVVRAIDAGAAFGVSPVLDPTVLSAALDAGLPFVPGAATPTEADAAWRAGATFVKLFPGSSLGTAFVHELRGPLPEIETIVTGGVDGSNAQAFLDAGAVAVGIGSALARMTRPERAALVAAACREAAS
jgi:2-dehydro-3-deoxyphosphogluconate aldolase/(4S)-4-hydroxy-2-oxoglutarate aldolase